MAQPIHDATGGQRSLVYVLPLTLPAAFDLEVDVRSTQSDLAHVRIVGVPLGIRDPAGSDARQSAEPAGSPDEPRAGGTCGSIATIATSRSSSRADSAPYPPEAADAIVQLADHRADRPTVPSNSASLIVTW